jgi:hypothetical protein
MGCERVELCAVHKLGLADGLWTRSDLAMGCVRSSERKTETIATVLFALAPVSPSISATPHLQGASRELLAAAHSFPAHDGLRLARPFSRARLGL